MPQHALDKRGSKMLLAKSLPKTDPNLKEQCSEDNNEEDAYRITSIFSANSDNVLGMIVFQTSKVNK
jgi:hypothetical protein